VELDYEGVVADLLHDCPLVHDLTQLGLVGHLVLLHHFHGINETCILLSY